MSDQVRNFRTQFDRERVFSDVGSRERILYAPEFDSNGHMELVETGKENIYNFIQSHKDSVDINLILKRFANGDASALSKRQGAFGDFTQLPTSYADMLNKVMRGEEYFQNLPVDVRSKFNHSFAEFMASMGTDDFFSKLGIERDRAPDAVTDVVDTVTGGAQVE